jgi:hypothetical protein
MVDLWMGTSVLEPAGSTMEGWEAKAAGSYPPHYTMLHSRGQPSAENVGWKAETSVSHTF